MSEPQIRIVAKDLRQAGETPEQLLAAEAERCRPDWVRFYGSNHEPLPQRISTVGGSVRFAQHLGQPLSAALWEDLLFRCVVNSLWVLRPGDTYLLLARGPGAATVYLDHDGLVSDIELVPHQR